MVRRYINLTFAALLILLVIGVGFSIATVMGHGGKLLSAQTGSMAPTIKKGDLVVVNRVPVTSLEVGDAITFINPSNTKQTITHRIVQIPSDINTQKFVTKGDANSTPDTPITASSIIGKVDHKVPYLGRVLDVVRKPIGLALIIYIPALAIIVEELKRLAAHYRTQQPYLAVGYDSHNKMSGKQKFTAGAKIVAFLAVISLAVAVPTHAALQSTTMLTGNTISTTSATPPNNCSGSTTSNSIINITNTSNQTATSGNATNSNNTNGGSATSGNASNSNNTNVNVNVNNCP